MIIKELDYKDFKNKPYHADIRTDRVLSIEPSDEGFSMKWVKLDNELVMPLDDDMLSDWLDNPKAYGAYEDDKLLGFVEGFLEDWDNRYRISNICVFEDCTRRTGVGSALLERIMQEAYASGARMAVLETQSFNYKAIEFYKKHGFEIIGFDRYAYSNNGPTKNNMRIEMGYHLSSVVGGNY